MNLDKINRKIDFLLVGTQKGGSSAIYKYFTLHPEIGMGKTKELHFFDNDKFFSKSTVDYSNYENLFDFKSNKKMYGESTPSYMYWDQSCKRIWEYNPNIKLIFVLRNPITRAFSHWNMLVDVNAEKKTFSEAIRIEKRRMKRTLPLQNKARAYVDRGFYSEQIRKFQRFFDDDQMLFIKYEEFKTKQEHTLLKMFKFLNVQPDLFKFKYKEVYNQKKHANISTEDKNFLINKYEHDIRHVERLLNWDCSDWLN